MKILQYINRTFANIVNGIGLTAMVLTGAGCIQGINSNPEKSQKSVEQGLIENGKCFGKYSGQEIQTRNPSLFMEIGNARARVDYARKCAGAKDGETTTLFGVQTIYDPRSENFYAFQGGRIR